MSERPYFSLFGPAIRPELYEGVYNNVSENSDIPFEIIFVGNVPPTKTMPDNFRYIYSEKSPAQCWDMGARATEGVLILPITDDVRYSKNFFNRAYYYTTIFDIDKILISFRFRYQWGSYLTGVAIDEGGFFDLKMPSSPTLGISGIYKKDLWIKLGGLDNRFYGGFADLDIILRFYYELGMSSFIIPDCFLVEIPSVSPKSKSLLRRSFDPRVLLNSLWTKEGVFSRKRQSTVESFIYE
jgi:hypothetical protein